MAFERIRTEFFEENDTGKILCKYDLASDQTENFKEETFNETARITAQHWQWSDKDSTLEPINDAIKHCAWYADKTDIGIHKMFWRRQLSRPFFSGGNPPCPLLTTMCMQRSDQDWCFECHSSIELKDWLEGHACAMRIMPAMLQGTHTSNCIHNAYKVAETSVRNFSDAQDGIPAKTLLEIHASRWLGKTRKNT